jgi:hypothetical protein
MSEQAVEVTADPARSLDVLLRDGCSAAQFLQVVAARSSATADAAWETLALIDQLYRRGKLSGALFHQAKSGIERRVLGIQQPVQQPERPAPKLVLAPEPSPAAMSAPLAALAPESMSTPVATRSPAAAPALPPAATAAELVTLREQVQAARLQAALYRERLEAIEGRRHASAYPADGESTPARSLTASRFQRYVAAVPAPQLALLGVLVGAVVLVLSLIRPAAPPRALPAPAAPVRKIMATPPPPAVPGQLSLTADRYLVAPGAARAVIGVQRSGGTSGVVTLEYWTVDLGAKAGQDYLGPGRATLKIPEGRDKAQIEVPILANPRRRHTEMFEVRTGRPGGGATSGETTRATVFILPP